MILLGFCVIRAKIELIKWVFIAATLDPIDHLRTRSTRILNDLTNLLAQSIRWILLLDRQ